MGETVIDSEHGMTIGLSDPMKIDPRRDRFPCCIVWTPLPLISWLVPFIGHVGICREDGVILDFAGPNFVCVDNFAFGAVARYIQINKRKESSRSSGSRMFNGESRYEQEEGSHEKEPTWDDALRKGTQEYQHHSYNIFTYNIIKLIFQASIYFIWKERNLRIHSGAVRHSNLIIKEIQLIVRARLDPLSRAQSSLQPGSSLLCTWFGLFQTPSPLL